jgi:hypothetical protein
MGCSTSKNSPKELPPTPVNLDVHDDIYVQEQVKEQVKEQEQVQENKLSIYKRMQDKAKISKLKKDVQKQYEIFSEKRKNVKPFLYEKYGLNLLVTEEKANLLTLLDKKEGLFNRRSKLLEKIWEHDADDINNLLNEKLEKTSLINILCRRTYWQIMEISNTYEKKYNCKMTDSVMKQLVTVVGIVTGQNTNLSKLLTFRLLPQPERDSTLLQNFTSGYYADEVGMLELLCTRTNIELTFAMDVYNKQNKLHFVEVIKNKYSNKNNTEFALKMLECQRDDSDKRLTDEVAMVYAKELYNAGAGRTFGVDPEPFIRILAVLTPCQFSQVNIFYKNNSLIKDIEKKIGGNFKSALIARMTDKYDFLLEKLYDTFKSGYSYDFDTISRIFGCLSLPDCIKLKNCYNKKYEKEKKSIEDELRIAFKSQQSCLQAYLALISAPDKDGPNNCCTNPIGSNKELLEEENEIENEAGMYLESVKDRYKKELTIEKGKESANLENKLLTFEWNSAVTYDIDNLESILKQLSTYCTLIDAITNNLPYDNSQIEDIYFTMMKEKTAAEAYIRVYTNHINHVTQFIQKRRVVEKVDIVTISQNQVVLNN